MEKQKKKLYHFSDCSRLDFFLGYFVNNNIQILGLTETHLKNDDSLEVLPHINCFCNNRSTASDGTAIIFSRELDCTNISHQFDNFDHLECTVVSILGWVEN